MNRWIPPPLRVRADSRVRRKPEKREFARIHRFAAAFASETFNALLAREPSVSVPHQNTVYTCCAFSVIVILHGSEPRVWSTLLGIAVGKLGLGRCLGVPVSVFPLILTYARSGFH